VLIDKTKTCTATFTLNTHTLTINKTGTGSGTIASNPSGVDCGAICSASFGVGSTVSLTATASAGSTFSGWSGDCTGTASPLPVLIDKTKTCTATFTLNQYALAVAKTGNGSGSVTGGGTYDYGTFHNITATASAGSTFSGWSGDCAGTASPLPVLIDKAKTCTATFTLNTHTLTINKTGTGSGTVRGGGTYGYGTVHQITAIASAGSTFTGWSGDCTGSASPFMVTMLNRNMSCTATFVAVGPHIQVSSVLLLEDFSSGMPASWTVSGAWTTDNTTCPKTLATPFVAPWAVVDSACTATNVEYLTTGAFSAKNCATAELAFTTQSIWHGGNGKIDISADNGTTWQTKMNLSADEGPRWKAQVMDELAGSSNSMVRFIYNNNTNVGYWAIDNIWVMCRPAALNFGADNQQKAFVIENIGTADLNIGAMNITGANSADFSISGDGCSSKTLKPADICGAKITFSTTSTGRRNAVLNVPSNDAVVSNTTVALKGMTTAVGDADNNGTMNIVDALFVARHAAGLSVVSFIADAADVNCDGAVNIVDALFIARKAAGLSVTGWCGQ